MAPEAPETEAPVRDPVETPLFSPERSPDDRPGPEKYYSPERLCPDQRADGGWRTRPLT